MAETLRILRYDQSGERTSTHFNVANMSTGTYNDAATRAAALGAALDAISSSAAATVDQSVRFTMDPTPDKAGNRELKWLIRITDTVNGYKFAHEVGCANDSLDVLNVGGKTVLDPSSTEYATVKTALEANALSPYGNAVVLTEVELVGRNL